MKEIEKNSLAAVIRKYESEILADWISEQTSRATRRDQAQEAELRSASKDFLAAIVAAMREGNVTDTTGPGWAPVRELLTDLSSRRAAQGYSPAETATFVFSLKQPVFARLRR